MGWTAIYSGLVFTGRVNESLKNEHDPRRTMEVALNEIRENLETLKLTDDSITRIKYYAQKFGLPNPMEGPYFHLSTIKEALQPAAGKLTELECDGSTRCISFLLNLAGIEYKTYRCRLERKSDGVYLPLHFFVVVGPYEIYVDYGAAHWFGPEGTEVKEVFTKGDLMESNLTYVHVQPAEPLRADMNIFSILTGMGERYVNQAQNILSRLNPQR